ncbi:MAG: HAMP domain-containing protein [Clostridia bacterium]|nr:HAMP domain-containing protein [Clostridia bacterium]
MYRKLQFKIVLILVSFIVCIMTVVGMILIGNIFSYYTNDFVNQQSSVFTESFITELEKTLQYEDYPERLKNTLWAYSAHIGIDANRNYFILDADGNYLSGSVSEDDSNIKKTENLVRAIAGSSSHTQKVGNSSTDWAEVLTSEDGSPKAIVYITENNSEMKEFSWMVFSIVLQSVLIGLVIAIILSFFLSKAIVSPIQSITKKATRLSRGDFDEKLTVYSDDEIGTLTHTFNKMADTLKNNLNEISNQREKLESIIHYLKDAVIAFDNEGNPMHINPEAKALFKLDIGAELTLDSMIEALDLDCRSDDLTVGKYDSMVLNNVIYDNRVFDISFGKFNFNLSDQRYGGYIAVLHDVTESFELDKSRREFIATVSHELGTPLTSIKGATETIVANPDMPNDVKNHFLEMVISESDRMTHIVHDLLVISRLDNNRMKWNPTSFPITELIE